MFEGGEHVEQAPEPVAEAPVQEEVVEAAPTEEPEPVQEEVDEYDLLDPNNRPSFIDEYAKLEAEGGRKLSVTREEIDSLPESAKRKVYNLQRGVMKQMEALANERKQLQADRQALKELGNAQGFESRELLQRILGVRESLEEQIKAMPESDDPYSAEAMQHAAAKRAVELIQKGFFEPLREKMEAAQAEYAEQQEQERRAARRTELEQFAEAHEDFRELIPQIKAYREKHPGVPAEDAYLLVKAKMPPKEPEDPRATSRRVSRRPTTVRLRTDEHPGYPEGVSSLRDMYEWDKRNGYAPG